MLNDAESCSILKKSVNDGLATCPRQGQRWFLDCHELIHVAAKTYKPLRILQNFLANRPYEYETTIMKENRFQKDEICFLLNKTKLFVSNHKNHISYIQYHVYQSYGLHFRHDNFGMDIFFYNI